MFYSIHGLCPSRNEMGGCGFHIQLWPAWRDAVAATTLTQQGIATVIDSVGRSWLDNCGFDAIFDPDNCGYSADKKKRPGPNARPLYQPNTDLRVQWGEWGPEHITVPGDACGLDIDNSSVAAPIGGKVLLPHNVDHMRQSYLLLVVFTFFADWIIQMRAG